MVRTRGHAFPAPQTSPAQRRRLAITACVAVLSVTTAFAAIEDTWNRLHSEPLHTSILSGSQWVQELLNGHRERIKQSLGVSSTIFQRLERGLIRLGGLAPRRYIGTGEQVAIFLYQAVTNNSLRQVAERFQRSNETISRSFRAVLDALLAPNFRTAYMKLPDNDAIPNRILYDPKLYPFFQHCRGAIDGSHLAVNPPALTRGRWRDRDGNLTQNMLAVCDFNMFFVFVMVGWEGSIADSALYDRATSSGGLTIMDGLYWIADAGFANCSTLLVPYRNTRYHLREWAAGNRRPQNKEELYNLRHAQLRNVIERIFGVLKREFKMAREACEYGIQVQCRIPFGLTILHNFYRTHDPNRHHKELHIRLRDEPPMEIHGDDQPQASLRSTISHSEGESATLRREEIANQMWEQYQGELATRRAHH